MNNYVTWLHLSDLHYCQVRTGWDSARVLKSLLDDLKRMQHTYGLIPELIFFTGDLVFGQLGEKPGESIADQFEGARKIIDAVRMAFDRAVPLENVFIVPGNHDVNRHKVTIDQTVWLENVSEPDEVISLIDRTPLQWHRYMERLHDYRTFLSRNYRHLLEDPDRLIYSSLRTINGRRIRVVGLNTAWSCCRDGEKGHLWTAGRWQISYLSQSAERTDLNICLMHHPSNWLTEHEDPELGRQIERDFDFSLHGHEHQEWIVSGPSHTRIAAGACYEGSKKRNGYNFARVNLHDKSGKVWLRRYDSNGGGWIAEIVHNKTDDDGIWFLENRSGKESPPTRHEFKLDLGQGETYAIPGTSHSFKTYSADLRPIVDAWVGRHDELNVLHGLKSGVAVVTGIGGQGKSTLVSKFLEGWIERNPEEFWAWRDFREEGERFLPQLIDLIEHFSNGQIKGDYLSEAGTEDVVRYFFELIGKRKGVVILDNVDSYVNQDDHKFNLGVNALVHEALRVRHDFLFILTCRPQVFYPSPRFTDIPLEGIVLPEAIELFALRGVKNTRHDEIEEIWSRTYGHPFWLDLIALQMSRRPQTAPSIVEELRKGHVDDQTGSMFRALWQGLSNQQQMILRCMVELSYPETTDSIHNFVRVFIKSRNQFIRHFEGLKSLSLLVERGSVARETCFDLHPLVRHFVHTEYPHMRDRLRYIEPILLALERLFEDLDQPSEGAALEELQRWTTMAELEIERGNWKVALDTLACSADRLIARGFHEEFFRVALRIVDQLKWDTAEVQDSEAFHDVVEDTISTLAEHKREDQARRYLHRYDNTARPGTVARLRYYKVAAHVEWTLRNFDLAIQFGREGLKLQEEVGINSEFDTRTELALALRDCGKLNEALELFAPGQTIEDILASTTENSDKEASFFGNVGRCLQLKDDLKNALLCYVASARMLNRTSGSIDMLNRGHAALWIAEVLERLDDLETSYKFYRQARLIWSTRSPLRAPEPQQESERLESSVSEKCRKLTDEEINSFCKTWIENWTPF